MIDDPNFSLDLGQSWHEVPGDDPERYKFRDDARDIAITLSAMPLDLAPEAIGQFASAMVANRLQAENDAARAFDHRTTIYEPIVVPRPWGSAVAYYGHDDTGRHFSYSGLVTSRSVINLYMSAGSLSEHELFRAMDEVASKIAFDQTPLGHSGPG